VKPLEIVRLEEETNPAYGKKPGERSIEEALQLGVIVLDKPCGPTSHEVSSWVRKMLGAEKAGHSGTLDPQVSGVLPIGVNRATRAMGFLLKSRKEYVCVMRLHKKVKPKQLQDAFKKFTGEITQTPPVKSAVKRRARKRKVYYINPSEYIGRDVLFTVGVEAGTYIRKLCHDIGAYLGVGANMLELRRTKVGSLDEGESITLQDLSDAFWLWKEKGDASELHRAITPVEAAIDLRKITLRDSAVEAICSGAPLAIPGIARYDGEIHEGELVALMSLKGELVALADARVNAADIPSMKRGEAAKTRRVVMEKGTYPKMWKTSKPAEE